MGCDIHCYVEKKVDGIWKEEKGFVSDHYDESSEYFGKEEFKNASSPIDCRNYELFSVLANVRNGSGFAGCDTGDSVKPISMPKGLPDNISDGIKEEAIKWDVDGHSHSWLTIKEIIDYKWDIIKTYRGYVTAKKYEDYLKTQNPYPCCGGVGGGNVKIVDKSIVVEFQKEHPDLSVYCQIEWERTMRNDLEFFIKKSLSQLKERCDSKDYTDVRIVFWFDN